jgi:hypothetical protein
LVDAVDTVDKPSNTFLPADHFRTTKYGSLRMADPVDSSRGSHRKVEWLCDCGRTTVVAVCSVVSGNTSSCRKCGLLTRDFLRTAKYGSLRMADPADMMPGSRKKVLWDCDCGRQRRVKFYDVIRGHTTSCGQCPMLFADHFRTTKYGSLRMADPADFLPGSHDEVEWLCDCGRTTVRQVGLVTSGHTSSCGKCNVRPPEFWADAEFGMLRMAVPRALSPGSNQDVEWQCRCGGTVTTNAYVVTSGKTVRCGQCRSRAVGWYRDNEPAIRALKTPFSASEIPPGWLTALEDVSRYDGPFRALCGACGSEYSPRWGNVVRGSSLTCGCASNHVSGAQQEIALFIEGLGLEVLTEHRIGPFRYDIHVPSRDLVVEYHGLRWHSRPGSRRRDLAKYNNAVEHGLDFMALFEDEWALSRRNVEQLLRSRLSLSTARAVRPSACEIRSVPHRAVKPFYEKFHYIGACSAAVHYGAFLSGRMVAAASFGHPTRQSRHPWELLRMASDPDYRIHGIWSKVLSIFVREHRPSSVVSFSDNRLFDGRTYEKIGFRLDGEVRSNYYWVKGNRRFHKSGLRKRGADRGLPLTEGQLREGQGYRRVWDLGKRRWVLTPA